jgi:hypothetical protein
MVILRVLLSVRSNKPKTVEVLWSNVNRLAITLWPIHWNVKSSINVIEAREHDYSVPIGNCSTVKRINVRILNASSVVLVPSIQPIKINVNLIVILFDIDLTLLGVNKRDGIHPDIERDCQYYYQCVAQKKLREAKCPNDQKFSGYTGKCGLASSAPAPCGTYVLGNAPTPNADRRLFLLICPIVFAFVL